jgi:hypothetical protein
MDEGFYPARKSVEIERGANFHLDGHVNEENQTCSGCDLIFEWKGPVSTISGKDFKPNILYKYGSWRYFIRDCTNNNLVMNNFIIRDEEYVKYESTNLEKMKYFLSKKRACDAFFSKHIGLSFPVRSEEF